MNELDALERYAQGAEQPTASRKRDTDQDYARTYTVREEWE